MIIDLTPKFELVGIRNGTGANFIAEMHDVLPGLVESRPKWKALPVRVSVRREIGPIRRHRRGEPMVRRLPRPVTNREMIKGIGNIGGMEGTEITGQIARRADRGSRGHAAEMISKDG